jgi:hypothetical protein
MDNTSLHGFEPKKVDNLEELEQMLQDAKKGIAKVDKVYVNYKEKGHLFPYKIDFIQFLEEINYILTRDENG